MRILERTIGRVVDVRPGEWAGVLLSAGLFFCVLSSWFVVRPVRDAMGIAGDPLKLPWLYMGTLAGMLVANPLFALLVSRFPRRRFIPYTYHFFTINLLIFFVLMRGDWAEKGGAVAKAFFVWGSVFNLFVVAVFWGFMADLWRSEQGKRLFGMVGIGGTLGAIAGAGATSVLVERFGVPAMLLVSAVLLQGAVGCVAGLSRVFRVDRGAAERTSDEGGGAGVLRGGGVLSGVRDVARSPYLLGICLLMVLYTVSSTFVYFEQAKIVNAAFETREQRTEAFARIDLYTQSLTVLMQMFVSGWALRRLGVGAALALLPVLTLGGFAALAASPTFAVLGVFQVVRRAVDYAIARPAREVLYTVVSREEKYKAKSLIDTFVYRGGDAAGAGVSVALTAMKIGLVGLTGLAAPLMVLWAAVGFWLGRRQSAAAAAQAPVVAPAPLEPALTGARA